MRRFRLTVCIALLYILVRISSSWKAVRATASGKLDFLFPSSAGSEEETCREVEGILEKWPFRIMASKCLVRSLSVFCLQKHHRAGLRIAFGVRGDSGPRWSGHCWLEKNGRILSDPEDTARYDRVLVLP